MKKNSILLSVVLLTISLTAFGVSNIKKSNIKEKKNAEIKFDPIKTITPKEIENEKFTNFNFDIGPRFTSFEKNSVIKAKTIYDILDEQELNRLVSFTSVSIIQIINDEQTNTREIGFSATLTEAQLRLLNSLKYSDSFLIRVDYQQKNKDTGIVEDNYHSPHYTIVPAKQAKYSEGNERLLDYFRNNSADVLVNIHEKLLQPAKLYFTVTETGSLENIRLDQSSNYPAIDQRMIELLYKLTSSWIPAENENGQKVAQELVVSFGLLGC